MNSKKVLFQGDSITDAGRDYSSDYHLGYWQSLRGGVEARAEVARRVAEKHGLIFVPLMERFDNATKLAPAAHWTHDGVHPTAAGHELIKRAWLEAFPG